MRLDNQPLVTPVTAACDHDGYGEYAVLCVFFLGGPEKNVLLARQALAKDRLLTFSLGCVGTCWSGSSLGNSLCGGVNLLVRGKLFVDEIVYFSLQLSSSVPL